MLKIKLRERERERCLYSTSQRNTCHRICFLLGLLPALCKENHLKTHIRLWSVDVENDMYSHGHGQAQRYVQSRSRSGSAICHSIVTVTVTDQVTDGQAHRYVQSRSRSGFRVQGSGFRVQGSGFRVQGSGMSLFHIRVNVEALVTGSITKWSQ